MFRSSRRAGYGFEVDGTPAIARVADAFRAFSNLLTLVCFGGAVGIVVLAFSRGSV